MKKFSIFIIVIIVICIYGCNNHKKNSNKTDANKKQVTELKVKNYSFDNPPKFRKDGELQFIDKTSEEILFKIDIEIASTDQEKAMGLMYRPTMDENKGMLFLFENEEIQSFYMRNTIIPLDIIYINSNYEIVDIYKNTKVLDETSLPSKVQARYVVEINAGLCDKYNIKEGDKIIF